MALSYNTDSAVVSVLSVSQILFNRGMLTMVDAVVSAAGVDAVSSVAGADGLQAMKNAVEIRDRKKYFMVDRFLFDAKVTFQVIQDTYHLPG